MHLGSLKSIPLGLEPGLQRQDQGVLRKGQGKLIAVNDGDLVFLQNIGLGTKIADPVRKRRKDENTGMLPTGRNRAAYAQHVLASSRFSGLKAPKLSHTIGRPNFFSINTHSDLGPRVTRTASAEDAVPCTKSSGERPHEIEIA
jgi:hypothetical protein